MKCIGSPFYKVLVLLVVMLAFSPVQAADVRISSLKIRIDVQDNSGYVETREMTEQLESERAAHEAAQIKLPHSSSMDDFVIEEAYTLKPDGHRLPVPSSSIFVQDGLISSTGLTSFQDIKTSVVVFPGVEAGDSIVLRYRLTRKKPMLTNVFSYSETFPRDLAFDDVHVTVTAPTNHLMQAQGIDVPMEGPTEIDGRTQWDWTYSQREIKATPEDALAALEQQPRILISSARSYDELADAIKKQFTGKSAVTKTVQTLADRITQGAKTPRERALRIQEWVAKNIRYFAVFLNVGGYVPRTADEVINSGYGDCKEHAVLLKALLAAKGIDSSVAILSTERIYELPSVPVLSAFNHAIVYVPSLDSWLESNTPWIRFGSLSWEELDKPVLLIDESSPIARTPAPSPLTNAVKIKSHLVISADGNASGQDDLVALGAMAIAYNGLADSLATTDPVQFASSALVGSGFQGSGTAAATRVNNVDDFHLTLLYDLPAFAPMSDASSVKALMPLDVFTSNARQTLSLPLSDTRYVCMAVDESESLSISFPPGTSLTLPKDVDVTAPHRRYQSSYRLNQSTVQIERNFMFDKPGATCEGSERSASRSIQQAILSDLRSEIGYVPPAVSP